MSTEHAAISQHLFCACTQDRRASLARAFSSSMKNWMPDGISHLGKNRSGNECQTSNGFSILGNEFNQALMWAEKKKKEGRPRIATQLFFLVDYISIYLWLPCKLTKASESHLGQQLSGLALIENKTELGVSSVSQKVQLSFGLCVIKGDWKLLTNISEKNYN